MVSLSSDLPVSGLITADRLRAVTATDRTATLGLFVGAAGVWLLVGWVLTNLSPVGSAPVQLFGALAIGTAIALTACPLLWLAATGRHRHRAQGGWLVAGRRAGLIGLVVSVIVLLRVIDALAPSVLVFLVVTALLVEVAVSIRR